MLINKTKRHQFESEFSFLFLGLFDFARNNIVQMISLMRNHVNNVALLTESLAMWYPWNKTTIDELFKWYKLDPCRGMILFERKQRSKLYTLSQYGRQLFYLAGLLHDVAKPKFRDIYTLNRELTTSEFNKQKAHASLSSEMINDESEKILSIDDPWKPIMSIISDAAGGHHERLDGSGYPNMLKGVDIPWIAKFFAVIDVFEALVSLRPYKDPWPVEKALGVIGDEVKNGRLHKETFLVLTESLNDPEKHEILIGFER